MLLLTYVLQCIGKRGVGQQIGTSRFIGQQLLGLHGEFEQPKKFEQRRSKNYFIYVT